MRRERLGPPSKNIEEAAAWKDDRLDRQYVNVGDKGDRRKNKTELKESRRDRQVVEVLGKLNRPKKRTLNEKRAFQEEHLNEIVAEMQMEATATKDYIVPRDKKWDKGEIHPWDFEEMLTREKQGEVENPTWDFPDVNHRRDDRLELLMLRRAEAEEINESIIFLEELAGPRQDDFRAPPRPGETRKDKYQGRIGEEGDLPPRQPGDQRIQHKTRTDLEVALRPRMRDGEVPRVEPEESPKRTDKYQGQLGDESDLAPRQKGDQRIQHKTREDLPAGVSKSIAPAIPVTRRAKYQGKLGDEGERGPKGKKDQVIRRKLKKDKFQ